jgi:hypothetical protein
MRNRPNNFVDYVCEKHGTICATFPLARVECGKCQREVAPEGTTLKEHHKKLKAAGRI